MRQNVMRRHGDVMTSESSSYTRRSLHYQSRDLCLALAVSICFSAFCAEAFQTSCGVFHSAKTGQAINSKHPSFRRPHITTTAFSPATTGERGGKTLQCSASDSSQEEETTSRKLSLEDIRKDKQKMWQRTVAEEEEEDEESEEETDQKQGGGEEEGADANQDTNQAFASAFRKRFEGKGASSAVSRAEDASAELRAFQDMIVTDRAKLQAIRAQIRELSRDLRLATMMERYEEAAALRDKTSSLFRQDPIALRSLAEQDMNLHAQQEHYRAAAAMRSLVSEIEAMSTSFQFGGVWKAMYGPHGDELLRIEYEGSKLVATKITGDQNVPAGEVTFQADLSPQGLLAPAEAPYQHPGEQIRDVFESKLGIGNVEAFNGLGQVALKGFVNPKMVPGQLLLFPHGILGFLFLPMGFLLVLEKVNSDAPPPPLTPPASSGPSAFDLW